MCKLSGEVFQFVSHPLRSKLFVFFSRNEVKCTFERGAAKQNHGVRFALLHQNQCGLGHFMNMKCMAKEKTCKISFRHHLSRWLGGGVMNAPQKFFLFA